MRKRKQRRAELARIEREQASALTAYGANNNNNNVAEIEGMMKPAAAVVYGGEGMNQVQYGNGGMGMVGYPEKQTIGVGMQEVYRPPLTGPGQQGTSYCPPQSQSPPPVYTNPSSTLVPSPPSQYSELDHMQTQTQAQNSERRTSNLSSQGAVSPLGSGFTPGQSPRIQSPPLSSHPQTYPPPPSHPYPVVNELQSHSEVNELEGENRGSWNVAPGVQELGGNYGGSSAGGSIARRPVGESATRRSQVDMNGVPLSEEFRHELQ